MNYSISYNKFIDGKCKTTIDFKTRKIEYKKNGLTGNNPNKIGKFMEDYWKFDPNN